MNTRYIFKTGVRPFVSTLKGVHYVKISKPTGESLFGMVVMKSTGKDDRNKLCVIPERDTSFHVATDRTAIKKKMRVLRESEAAELDVIAAEMEALRQRKNEILQRAWDKGNVVTVKELTDLIEG